MITNKKLTKSEYERLWSVLEAQRTEENAEAVSELQMLLEELYNGNQEETK